METGLIAEAACEAEVGDLGGNSGEGAGRPGRLFARGFGLIAGLHEDIRGLEIAVDDSLAVCGVDGQGERSNQVRHLIRGPGGAVEPVGERAAVDPLHREIGTALQMADLVHLDDIDVLDAGGQLGFAEEADSLRFGGKLAGENHLEGDQAVQATVPGLVNDAHAAASDFGEDLVIADPPRRGRRRRVVVGGRGWLGSWTKRCRSTTGHGLAQAASLQGTDGGNATGGVVGRVDIRRCRFP